MAILSTITCRACRQEKRVWHDAGLPPKTCTECDNQAAAAAKQAHLEALQKLTVEERLRRIEEILYDQPAARVYDPFRP